MARGHDGCSAGGYTAQSLSQHLLTNRRQTHDRFVRDQHFWQASKRQSKGDSDSLATGQRIDALLHQVRQAGVLESSTVQDADGHVPVADVGDLDLLVDGRSESLPDGLDLRRQDIGRLRHLRGRSHRNGREEHDKHGRTNVLHSDPSVPSALSADSGDLRRR